MVEGEIIVSLKYHKDEYRESINYKGETIIKIIKITSISVKTIVQKVEN